MTPLIAFLTLQGVPQDGAPTYLKDPAYAKPITVEMALQPLSRVVDAMARASGQRIAVAGLVHDLKATVLVKSLPIGRTMEALADTLGLAWQPDGSVLRLGPIPGSAAQEAAYLKEEETTAQNFARGSTVMSVPARTRMEGFANEQRPIRRPGRRTPMGEGVAGAKAGPRFDFDLLAMEVPEGAPPSRLDPAAPSGDSTTAFAKAARAWPTISGGDDPAWNRPVAPAQPASTWNGGKLALADLLVAWHAASGLPVVADAFRVPMRTANLPPATALGLLQALATNDHLSLKLADGIARVRHPAFWRLRTQEVSETAWSQLERSGTSLDNLTTFAVGLTSPQAAAFRSLESPLAHVSTTALREAYPGLLLWSALPDGARSALLAGRGVGLAQVQGATDAYAYALSEAPYYGAGDSSAVLAMNPAKVGIFGHPSATGLTLTLAGERGGGVGYVLPAP